MTQAPREIDAAARLLRSARFLVSAADVAQLPADDLPEVAFVGRSNAGKSSALNCLCDQRALARVSRTPGRTQLLNLFVLGPEPVGRLVDLPGYGYARVPAAERSRWDKRVGGYVIGRPNLRGLVLLADVRRLLTPLDEALLEHACGHGRPVHILLTKADKLSRGGGAAALARLLKHASRYPVPPTAQLFSVPLRLGVGAARRQVCRWLWPDGAETLDG
ncbi:MAG TPA: ribosome biogenesis GTP-binding protein YihA/YsxC [Nevskiaceae bacterium]